MKKLNRRTAATVFIMSLLLQAVFPFESCAFSDIGETGKLSSGSGFEVIHTKNDLCPDFEAEEVSPVTSVREFSESLSYAGGEEHSYSALDSQTEVKDQGMYDTCWAFAITAAAEASMILNGYSDSFVDYSEHGLAYFMYNSPQNDPLGLTSGDRNVLPSGKTYKRAGGNPVYALMMLSGWKGMQDETLIPYCEIASPSVYKDEFCFINEAVLKQGFIYNISKNPELVKEAVRQYGGATLEFSENHCGLIVGWDDDYPKENFVHEPASPSQPEKQPENNGAWLVKNSYGTGFGEDGYCWVSYEDESIGPNSVAMEFIPADTYAHNFHYDGTAGSRTNVYESTGQGTLASGGSAANIFRNETESAQLLEAVNIGIKTANTAYRIQIYTKTGDMKNPTDGTPAFDTPLTGTTTASGLYCIELPEPVYLAKGKTFSVVVQVTNAKSPVIEMFTDKSVSLTDGETTLLTFHNSTATGQSYIKSKETSSWADWAKTGSASASWTFRIKAFTNDTEEQEEEEGGEEEPQGKTYPDSLFFKADELSVKKGNQLRLTLSYSPAERSVAGLTFDWESDDTEVATVKKGASETEAVIKAKNIGSCMIYVSCREHPELSAVCYIDVTASSVNSSSGGSSSGGGGGGTGPSAGTAKTAELPYSNHWYQGTDGSWYLKGKDEKPVTSVWVCDDVKEENRGNIWYLIGTDGKMESSPLVQDISGNYYSLEMRHEGNFGMLRWKNGSYDLGNGQSVYLEFEQTHNGSFGAIKNKEGIEALKKQFGVKVFPISDKEFLYTRSLD